MRRVHWYIPWRGTVVKCPYDVASIGVHPFVLACQTAMHAHHVIEHLERTGRVRFEHDDDSDISGT